MSNAKPERQSLVDDDKLDARIRTQYTHLFLNTCGQKTVDDLSKRLCKKIISDISPSVLTKGLKIACETGNADIVSLLLNKGVDLNKKNSIEDDKTALHIASERGHYSIVAILIPTFLGLPPDYFELDRISHKLSCQIVG